MSIQTKVYRSSTNSYLLGNCLCRCRAFYCENQFYGNKGDGVCPVCEIVLRENRIAELEDELRLLRGRNEIIKGHLVFLIETVKNIEKVI